MLIRHVMVRAVITVAPGSKCRAVLRELHDARIRHAPVVEDERVVGVVSERDLLRQLPGSIGELEGEAGWKAEQSVVRTAMKRRVSTCSPNDAVSEVARRMLEEKVGCLPVLEDDRLVGIVTASDLLRGFSVFTREGGVRLSIMVPADSDAVPATYDPAEACVRLGLRLSNLLSSPTPGGSQLYLVHVDAPDADALVQDALAAGCTLLNPGSDRSQPAA